MEPASVSENEKFWALVVNAARGLGLDPHKYKSWEALSVAVVAEMGNECCVCHQPGKTLGLYQPLDPNSLRLLYIICDPDNHTFAEVETILEKSPITKV